MAVSVECADSVECDEFQRHVRPLSYSMSCNYHNHRLQAQFVLYTSMDAGQSLSLENSTIIIREFSVPAYRGNCPLTYVRPGERVIREVVVEILHQSE
jgi:hypothetical protein